MRLSPGTRLGNYEVVAAIGAGGMGEVYRAKDTKLGRHVALKVLTGTIADDAERQARFAREARTLAALNHPGIVTIYSVEEVDGMALIAMEFVEGHSLSEQIPKSGFPLDRLLNIAVQLANAVAAAHKHDVVHRDLKPANVMLGPQDRVKVLDFGLAKLSEPVLGGAETALPEKEITGEGRILGTVAYMSPEQAEGRPVDERSDVFSLGVMLYEMASGERPFKGDTSLSLLSAILKDTPKALGELNPALPRELGRYVRRCLAKDPDERYQSAADLRNDLEDLRHALLSGELSPARSSTARVAASPRTQQVVLVLGILALAAVSVGWVWSRERTPVDETTSPQLNFNRLTLLEGTALDPNISPDGKWVVYVSAVSGNSDIYLQSTTGQASINLTKDSPASDTTPAFSPDGELIVFRSERDGGGLFVMGRTGESVRRLTRTGFQPTWFPDGTRIAYNSIAIPNPATRGPGVAELWVVDAAGGEPQRLFAADAVQPRVSPHGQRIAYWGLPLDAGNTTFGSANRDVWTIAADGSTPVRVTTEAATDWNPVWSPDGRWLYFLSDRRGSMNLWRIAIDEATGATRGTPQPLTAPANYIRHFSLSADGSTGTFATLMVTNNLASAAFDAQSAKVVGPVVPLTSGPRDFQTIDVAPGGRDIALQTSFRTQEDLYLIGSDGTGLRNLTNDQPRDRSPQWAPNGRQLMFYSDRGGNYEVWSINRDGGSLRQMTQSGGQRYYPVPSPDGSRVAVANIDRFEIYVYPAADFSKPLEQLPTVPDERRRGIFVLADWSPDGEWLSGLTAGSIWVYSFSTRTYRFIAPGGQAHWLPDSRRLLVGRQGRVFITDVPSGNVREIFAMPGEIVQAPRLSPDGKTIYFLRGSSSGDIWTVRLESEKSEVGSQK
jgi:serine/threonine protein kinase/WD40 repeat protein